MRAFEHAPGQGLGLSRLRVRLARPAVPDRQAGDRTPSAPDRDRSERAPAELRGLRDRARAGHSMLTPRSVAGATQTARPIWLSTSVLRGRLICLRHLHHQRPRAGAGRESRRECDRPACAWASPAARSPWTASETWPRSCPRRCPRPSPATSFTTMASAPLRSSLARPFSMRFSVSAAKPTMSCPGRRRRTTSARMSSVGASSSVIGPVRLSFCSETLTGR